MTPFELHEVMHEAMQECPQFDPFDDDQNVLGWGKFGKVPRKGHANVIRFWQEATSLFDLGYDKALPQEVRDLLDRIDDLSKQAIRKAISERGLEQTMSNLRQYETDQTRALLDLVERMNYLHSDMGGRDNRPERKALAQCIRVLVKCIKESQQ